MRQLLCMVCEETKVETEFALCRREKRGRQFGCKLCNRKRSAEYSRSQRGTELRHEYRRRIATQRGIFASRIKTLYGITVEDWAHLFNNQDGKCAVCSMQLFGGRDTHIDHCHNTGRVRGLLCIGCNTAIGQVLERPSVLRALADYLERG